MKIKISKHYTVTDTIRCQNCGVYLVPASHNKYKNKLLKYDNYKLCKECGLKTKRLNYEEKG